MHTTSSQVAIAWVLAQGRSLGLDMVALVGSRTSKQLDESLSALKLTLSREDLQRIQAAVPANEVAGLAMTPFRWGIWIARNEGSWERAAPPVKNESLARRACGQLSRTRRAFDSRRQGWTGSIH